MRLLIRCIGAFSLLGNIAASDVGDRDETSVDLARLQGVWKTVEIVSGDERIQTAFLEKLTVSGTRATFESYDEGRAYANVTMNAEANPKEIDFRGGMELNEDFFLHYCGIYSIDGNRLRLSFNRAGGNRPDSFETKGRNKSIWTLNNQRPC